MNGEFHVGDDGVNPYIGDQHFLFRRAQLAKEEADLMAQ
jgi:hypothetical protein